MRWLPLAACFAFAACQPLYGGKPEHLKKPEPKKRPPEAEAQVQEIKYSDDCNVPTPVELRKWGNPQPAMANTLADQGDTAAANADKESDEAKKVALWRESLDRYKSALNKDPFNIHATLYMAVEYDHMQRKGCAIAMLKRLNALSNSGKYHDEANRNIDAIDSNGQWFKGYRKEAMSAVGR